MQGHMDTGISREHPLFRALKALAARVTWWRPPSPGPSADPYAGVREPRTRGPAGRSTAAAVMEPPPESSVRAVGRSAERP